MNINPSKFGLETSTIWSFPNRGNWATHNGNYRGNWSPYVPRNLILMYSQEGDWILDQFCGSGTTLVEAKILNRNAIGVDCNQHAVALAKKNLNFDCNVQARTFVKQGNAQNLRVIKDEKIDFICTHPPYADIIKYSNNINTDLSNLAYEDFLQAMNIVASEAYRVVKPGKFCAIMMGDMRKHGRVVPLGFKVMNCFLEAGFINKEIIIKEQHNCNSTAFWQQRNNKFLLLAHEYIFVFEKPFQS